MYKFDKKLIFFYFANGSSLIFGLLLYLLIVTNSDQNLPKLMFAYSIHLILASFLTFGSNLYLFESLSSKEHFEEKISIFKKNFFFFIVILLIGFSIVGVLSILDFFISPYKKNFNLDLYPFFFTAFFLSINKILYFCFLGFKFFKYCYSIIIIRSALIFFIITIFVTFTNFSFEISVLASFMFCELAILLISIKLLRKKIKMNLSFNNYNFKEQISNSFKLFGDYIFAEIILKVDIFFSMLRFELKHISIYLLALVFIEGLMTFTIVVRNYFSSQFGNLIYQKKYSQYIHQFKKYSLYSMATAILFIILAASTLLFMNKYLFKINFLVFEYFGIMIFGYLIYSYFGISELIFLNSKKYFKQTLYYILAIFTQLVVILLFINNLGILSFPIAICSMYIMMSLFILTQLLRINFSYNK